MFCVALWMCLPDTLLGDYLGALDQFTSDVEMQFSFAFAGKANALGGEHGGIITEYYCPQDESAT